MPKLMGQADTQVTSSVSGFQFSAQRIDTLGASEYTLVCVASDISGSVGSFRAELESAYKNVVGSCRKSPRAENILVRGTTFNGGVSELHGYQQLSMIDENAISLSCYGNTALFDASLEAIESIGGYGKQLRANDYLVNAVIFIITDGDDNASKVGSPAKVKKAIEDIKRSESLESIKVILIGLGNQTSVQAYLDTFKNDAALDQFVWVGAADAKALAKMAQFVSASISASSQSLGTGGPSKNLSI